MSEQLKKLREQIDSLDDQLLALLDRKSVV
jgi:chorismate mutase